MNLCPACNKREKQDHHNSKWCLPCALEFRRRPQHHLSRAQIRQAEALIGRIPREEIAEKVGCSLSELKRAFRGVALWFHYGKYKNRPDLVREVIAYYERHGKPETVKAFPGVNVKSIIDRPSYYGVKMKPRQVRWKDSEIVLAAKMAGIVDGKTQAKIFNRPGANEGSIKSLWMKRFKTSGGNVHGMSEWMAKEILKPGYPLLKTRVWSPRKPGVGKQRPVRGIVLWCEMEPYLKQGTPNFIRDAVKSMAQFQCWLFQTDDPAKEIRRLAMLQNGKDLHKRSE